jgi:hypothetical protein
MAGKELTKKDVKDIVSDELKKFVRDELDNEIKSLLAKTNSASRDEINVISRKALEALYKFMWIKRNIWQSDIK